MTISTRIKLGNILRNHRNILKIAHQLNKLFYTTTGFAHTLPDFLIIGAARSGTTSLYEYLIQHPSIIRGIGKEVYFFDKEFQKGVNWYKSFFPTNFVKSRLENKLQTNCLTCEATPRYLYHPSTPKRVFEIIPNVKLIILLRNPIDRAYSHYQMEVSSGNEDLSFEDAIDQEKNRISDDMQKMENDENFYSVNFYRKSYLTRGIYVDQIKRWFKYFPREQFLILKSENLYSDPSKVYGQVLDFLDLSKFKLNSFEAHRMRKYSNISPETRKKLSNYFKPHNKQLYELLGKNFNWDYE
jgi:hypothetical protein